MVKVGLCCMIKEENLYLKEFIDYYLKLGFDKIFIYDNNSENGEHPEIVTNNYSNNLVEVVNFRNRINVQKTAYDDCYQKFGKYFDWLAFFDIDEYLILNKHNNIKEYLEEPIFKNFDMIHINWMLYDDNDLLHYDSRPMIERFTRPCDFNIHIENDSKPVNRHIKSLLKCEKNICWRKSSNPHTPYSNNLKCCNNCGFICPSNSPYSEMNFDWAYLKHFTTKTIEEYTNKKKRGFPEGASQTINLNHFFIFNKETEQKKLIWNNIIK